MNHARTRPTSDTARPLRVPPSCKYVTLKSDTGSGKNHQIDILLRALLYGQYNRYHTMDDRIELEALRDKLGPNPGVLLLSPRVLYAIEMTRKNANHGAQSYQNADKYEDAPMWIWGWHSLCKYNKRAPRIIIIDEAELNRQVWTDNLNKSNQSTNQDMQEFLIKNADLVIVTDATLSEGTIDVISMIDPEAKWFIQENTFQSNTKSIVRNHDTLESITNRCVSDLVAGKVLSIPSGSLSKLDKFRDEVCKRLPTGINLKHKTFNSKTPGRERDFEKGLDEALKKEFTMLLYTGSMGVGVEYTLEHVDKRYLLVNYNIVGADWLFTTTRTSQEA
jgi:hypothetical protein